MEKKEKSLKKNSTERALIASALSIVLCCAALFGTTYAWFNQTVVANVGIIQTGTLTAEIVDAEGNAFAAAGEEGKILEFLEVAPDGTLITPAEGEKTILEPGKTYQLPGIRIKNPGDIDFRYEVILDGVAKPEADAQEGEAAENAGTDSQGGAMIQDGEALEEAAAVADLRDVLIFTATINEVVEEGEQPSVINFTAGEKITGILPAGDDRATTDVNESLSDTITISVAFDTTADLVAYQGLQLSDVKIIVYATQLMERDGESDMGSNTED